MKPNAMYLRKSRSDPEDETTEETLDKHKRTLTEFTQKSGLEISEIYKEVVSRRRSFFKTADGASYAGYKCREIRRSSVHGY